MLKNLFTPNFLPVAKLDPAQPMRVNLEKAIQAYWQAAHGVSLPLIEEQKAADSSRNALLDPSTATIADLRALADSCVREMDRLLLLPDRKTVFTIRTGPYEPLLFTDKSQKDVKFWALSNPNDQHRLYEEVIVKDGEGYRVLEQKCLGVPTQDAKESTHAS